MGFRAVLKTARRSGGGQGRRRVACGGAGQEFVLNDGGRWGREDSGGRHIGTGLQLVQSSTRSRGLGSAELGETLRTTSFVRFAGIFADIFSSRHQRGVKAGLTESPGRPAAGAGVLGTPMLPGKLPLRVALSIAPPLSSSPTDWASP